MILAKFIGAVVLLAIGFALGEANGIRIGIKLGRRQQRWPYETDISTDRLGNIVVKPPLGRSP